MKKLSCLIALLFVFSLIQISTAKEKEIVQKNEKKNKYRLEKSFY